MRPRGRGAARACMAPCIWSAIAARAWHLCAQAAGFGYRIRDTSLIDKPAAAVPAVACCAIFLHLGLPFPAALPPLHHQTTMRRSARLLGLARRLGAEATAPAGGAVAEAGLVGPRYLTASALRTPIIGGAAGARSWGSQVVVSRAADSRGPGRAFCRVPGLKGSSEHAGSFGWPPSVPNAPAPPRLLPAAAASCRPAEVHYFLLL